MKLPILLLVARLLLVIGLQFAAALVAGSQELAMPWWPYLLVIVEAVTLSGLVLVLRQERLPTASIFVAPFDQGSPSGKVGGFLARRLDGLWAGLAADVGRFALVMAVLGVPALVLNEFVSSNVAVLRDTPTSGSLPDPAVIALFFLLPVAQLVEFPFYYGYVFPRLESQFEARGSRRGGATALALAIVVVTLALQIAFVPMVFSATYVAWRMIAMLPVLFVIGVVIRAVPRFMIGANIVHMAMAVMVVLDFWRG